MCSMFPCLHVNQGGNFTPSTSSSVRSGEWARKSAGFPPGPARQQLISQMNSCFLVKMCLSRLKSAAVVFVV